MEIGRFSRGSIASSPLPRPNENGYTYWNSAMKP
jgi:hypothetical protein